MRDAVVVGAGQSGLAVSYYLRKYGADFVVLDASDAPGGAWPHYWDALTLFSRAEFSNLPGWPMPNFDGYPPRDHVVDYLTRYERRYDLPIRRGERVTQVRYDGSAFHLNSLTARNVVMATGIWSAPFVPFVPGTFAGTQLHSASYRRPSNFAGQRVAVVGGGNSGAQIVADLGLAGVSVQWFTRRPPSFMPEDIDGEQLFRRNRERFVAIAHGEEDPGGADFRGEIVQVPEVRRAKDAGLLGATPMPAPLDQLTDFDAIIWATGFRPALSPIRGIPRDTPGLFVLGFDNINGPGAGTIGGVSPFARDIARQITGRRQ
ncbi:NAD(P)-binding domain-containing protein [Corynebacterium ureicelerivorans]